MSWRDILLFENIAKTTVHNVDLYTQPQSYYTIVIDTTVSIWQRDSLMLKTDS